MSRIIVAVVWGCMVWIGAGWSASTAFAASPVQANLYELAGKGVRITYAASSVAGEPRLTIRNAAGTRTFKGSEIRITANELGQMVSVMLEQIPDLRTVTLTVLVPDVNLTAGAPVLIRTEAITTTVHTSIGGPALVKGPLQTYAFLPLKGKASWANTVAKASGILGEVSLAPTCPGPQRPGQVCEQPYANIPVQLLDATYLTVTATTRTDAQGLFALDLAPGDYLVHVVTPGALPRCPDVKVTVPKDSSVTADIVCDTGIR